MRVSEGEPAYLGGDIRQEFIVSTLILQFEDTEDNTLERTLSLLTEPAAHFIAGDQSGIHTRIAIYARGDTVEHDTAAFFLC